MLNKAGNLLLLENNEDFYELSFGNLAKEDAIIIVEVSEGEVPQNLSYEIFNKTGAIESNSINFSTIASNFLYQNFPNPFHDSTTFQYDLATASNVKFIIYDIRGRIVNEINEGYKEPGQYSYVWNATNKDDRKVSSGVYFYQLYLDNYQSTKKMTFIYKKE